jgi:acyl carrier protein
MTATETKLIDVLTTGLKLQRATVSPQTAIFGQAGASLGLDSVDVLEIAVLLDKHFHVVLSEQNAEVNEALTNIGALAAYIDRHTPANPASPA